MNKSTKRTAAGRRGFLKTVALAAGGASQVDAQEKTAVAQASPSGAAAQSAPPVTAPVSYPRIFTGNHLAMIAFPLGGVAAGSVALGGRGQLRDWEIFNRPDKGKIGELRIPQHLGAGGERRSRWRACWNRG